MQLSALNLTTVPLLPLLFSPILALPYGPDANANSNPTASDLLKGITYTGTTTSNGIEHFYSIPYAYPPTGPNRFAPAIPITYPANTTKIIDAGKVGPWCPQETGPGPPLPFTSVVDNVAEDCLSVTVHRVARGAAAGGPAEKVGGGKGSVPVLVWLHGGGNILGSPNDRLYTPDGLLLQAETNETPVIWVGVQYRLGIFGYAANQVLKEQNSMNIGLRDQRVAFEWIRNNIATFGGDPEKITAIGQSAGALAVGMHLVSYGGTQGVPFDQGIMISGATGTNFNGNTNMSADHTAAVAEAVGCTEDRDSPAILDCMRNVPFEKLTEQWIELSHKERPPFGELWFSPSVDGDLIPELPSKLLRKAAFVKDIPLIASWVADEGAWYADSTITTDQQVIGALQRYILNISPDSFTRLLELYPVDDFAWLVAANPEATNATSQYYRAAEMAKDIWFTCPVVDFTYHYAFSHSPIAGGGGVYLYEFNQTKFQPVWNDIGTPEYRVSHLSDVPYMLNEDVAGGGDNSPKQQALSKIMSSSLAQFAYTGDPNTDKGLVGWPNAYGSAPGKGDSPEEIMHMLVGEAYGKGPVVAKRGGVNVPRNEGVNWEMVVERCEFIATIADELGV